MLEQHRATTEAIEALLDGYNEDEDQIQALQNSSLSWQWTDTPDAVQAFDQLCRLAGPDSDMWADLEDDFEDLAAEHADYPTDHLQSVLGAAPTAREYASYVFSRQATVPVPGTDATVGEWVHDGTGTLDGVTYTAFTALGIEEHLGFAFLTDGTDGWVLRYSPV